MLDIKLIRETPEVVRKDLEKRRDKEKLGLLEAVIKQDKIWRKNLIEVDRLKHKRNVVSKEISCLKQEKKDTSKNIDEMRNISRDIKNLDEKNKILKEKINRILLKLPNLMHLSVPVGEDENDNKTVKTWGVKPKFSFTPKSHVDLLEDLDVADIETAARVSGARFYYLKNELVLLDFALMRFAMDRLAKKGFILVEPPFALRRKPYEGVTDLGDFEDVMYKIENDDLYLIATSEHAIAQLHANQILDKKELPLRYVGVSPCYRKEAGAHGKDTKGIFRVHQFNKVEQFVFSTPENSWKIHEELLKNSEYFYQKLKIPYRVVNICTGDLGTVASKKYDIEAWMPAQKKYREVGSCSNCTDYQARRMNIKFRDGKETRFAHTLNNTAIATSRTIVAILENFQQKDGSVKIPRCLWEYMSGVKKIEPK